MAAKRRHQDARDRDLTLAWQIEALHRAKRLPALKTLLDKTEKPRPQTVSEQRTILEALSQTIGVPLRKRQVA